MFILQLIHHYLQKALFADQNPNINPIHLVANFHQYHRYPFFILLLNI